MTENIIYTPSDVDLKHMDEIRDFLNEEGIPFEEDKETFGLIHLNERTIQLRYVDSYYFPIDQSSKFGEKCKGVDKNYFSDISHENFEKGIRTIWCFDFEMEQENKEDFVDFDGNPRPHYRRQWEVIKNTIRTACGKIHHKFYARDCDICEVSNDEARRFLMTYCFYGYRSANVHLGLRLKKDKYGLKAGTLLFYYSFGSNFYGNRRNPGPPKVEIIRASTRIGCQVVGGISKCIKHFCENYPTMTVANKTLEVNDLIFYVDASHNDSRGMRNSNSAFEFVSWSKDGGFMNRFVRDVDDGELKGKAGEIFMRKPRLHKLIMKHIGEGDIVSIGNAGTIVYKMNRRKFVGLEPLDPNHYVKPEIEDSVKEVVVKKTKKLMKEKYTEMIDHLRYVKEIAEFLEDENLERISESLESATATLKELKRRKKKVVEETVNDGNVEGTHDEETDKG